MFVIMLEKWILFFLLSHVNKNILNVLSSNELIGNTFLFVLKIVIYHLKLLSLKNVAV